jgi:hypothetical protein
MRVSDGASLERSRFNRMNQTSLIDNANYQSGFYFFDSTQIKNQRTIFTSQTKKAIAATGNQPFLLSLSNLTCDASAI